MTSKALDYQALMALDETSIQASFPFGAIESKKGWRPAEEGEESRSLKQLLKDKRERLDRPRFLRRTPPSMRNPKDDTVDPPTAAEIREAAEQSAYTSSPKTALECVDAVPSHFQRQITAEAWERFNATHHEEIARRELRSYLESLRQLGIEAAKAGADPVRAVAMAAAESLKDDRKAA